MIKKQHKIENSVELKHCYKCSNWKELGKFNKDSSRSDGFESLCKKCKAFNNKLHYNNNIEQYKLNHKNHYENNKPTYNERSVKRRLLKMQRTPTLLSKKQRSEVIFIYELCKTITELTDIKHHVDHIVPLQGKKVSGLHVPWNLQILTAKENLEKSNRWESE